MHIINSTTMFLFWMLLRNFRDFDTNSMYVFSQIHLCPCPLCVVVCDPKPCVVCDLEQYLFCDYVSPPDVVPP
jgi:hypothetical protein